MLRSPIKSSALELRIMALSPRQFAFSRHALMLFARTLDLILELVAVVRE
jgi:hypothetical protein